MASHDPWKNPPLKEALFEIRFQPVSDYAIFVGGIAASLHEKFPYTEKLEAAEIPHFIQFEGVARHRFFSQDRAFAFQTGFDVVSVHVIAYSGFAAFSKTIRDVLDCAQKFVAFEGISRLGVRYINVFDEPKDLFGSLNITPPFSSMEIDKTEEVLLKLVKREQEDITVNTTVSLSSNNNKSLFLDIDAFYNPSNIKWDIDLILSWISKAHDVVYENFDSLVSLPEKGERK